MTDERNHLMRAIVKAGQDAGIIRTDLESVSISQCLHILECLVKASGPVAGEAVRYSYDDLHIGVIREDGKALKTRIIHRPCFNENAEWYNYAGKICDLLNGKEVPHKRMY